MIKNLKTKLWLNAPINFHDICMIHPLTVQQYLHYMDVSEESETELSYAALMLPFTLNETFLKEHCPDFPGTEWDFLFANATQIARFMFSVAVLTDDSGLKPDLEKKRLVFANGKTLGREHFDEFSEIILQAHYLKKYKPSPQKKMAVKNPKHQQRLQKYLAHRNKNTQLDDDVDLAVCVKYIQIASQSYIPDKEILAWTYWKLLRWHSEMIRQIEYQNGYACYATSGDKKLGKTLTKLQTELRTKI